MEKFEILEPEVRLAFMDSVIRHLRIEEIRKFITVPRPSQNAGVMQMYAYGSAFSTVAPIHEYADYLNVTETNAVEKARILGAGCAILYNALIKDVRLTLQHNTVVDLLENENLKFNFVLNAEPSAADPWNLIPGWISFRFHFASSNMATSIKPGATLKTLEGYAH
jgi:hypothetical protein